MRPYALGRAPPLSTRPEVALWPKIPLKNAGMRMLPPTSEPTPHAVPAADTRQPSPPEEPPTVRPVWYGLLERPNTYKGAFTTLPINCLQLYSGQWVTLLLLSIHMQSSDTLVTPSRMQPADFMAATTGASSVPWEYQR